MILKKIYSGSIYIIALFGLCFLICFCGYHSGSYLGAHINVLTNNEDSKINHLGFISMTHDSKQFLKYLKSINDPSVNNFLVVNPVTLKLENINNINKSVMRNQLKVLKIYPDYSHDYLLPSKYVPMGTFQKEPNRTLINNDLLNQYAYYQSLIFAKQTQIPAFSEFNKQLDALTIPYNFVIPIKSHYISLKPITIEKAKFLCYQELDTNDTATYCWHTFMIVDKFNGGMISSDQRSNADIQQLIKHNFNMSNITYFTYNQSSPKKYKDVPNMFQKFVHPLIVDESKFSAYYITHRQFANFFRNGVFNEDDPDGSVGTVPDYKPNYYY